MDKDLNQRLFNFAVSVIFLLREFDETKEYKVISYQLIKSATSSSANYEEAQAASSRPDFRNKISISLKEMRESNYWLRLLQHIRADKNNELLPLINESEELKKILGSICSKVSKVHNLNKLSLLLNFSLFFLVLVIFIFL